MLVDLSLSIHKLQHLGHPLHNPIRSILQKSILYVALSTSLEILLCNFPCRPQDHRIASIEAVAIVHQIIENFIVAELEVVSSAFSHSTKTNGIQMLVVGLSHRAVVKSKLLSVLNRPKGVHTDEIPSI